MRKMIPSVLALIGMALVVACGLPRAGTEDRSPTPLPPTEGQATAIPTLALVGADPSTPAPTARPTPTTVADRTPASVSRGALVGTWRAATVDILAANTRPYGGLPQIFQQCQGDYVMNFSPDGQFSVNYTLACPLEGLPIPIEGQGTISGRYVDNGSTFTLQDVSARVDMKFGEGNLPIEMPNPGGPLAMAPGPIPYRIEGDTLIYIATTPDGHSIEHRLTRVR
ncbi:MAG: hypothetical protein RMM10_04915 [Anaerolineae bacterium]|uniref:hypothetical protein n=1 Tax=Thermoflexus sp. TaxID=1969742 RepID=UPI0025E86A94|nr:hypothetical protein [Thermoflexus sp.]MCS7350850.1 hypothetical protein [Thermoflexus sp.]MDW8180301.1 hypothetical protein [Anaerolineae bacterium]